MSSNAAAVALDMVLHIGTKLPDAFTASGMNNFLLRPNQWNHIVWETPHLQRDCVRELTFVVSQQNGNTTNRIVCFIDQLELHQVQADPFEGWAVAPGVIALSQTGYQLGGSNTAIASKLEVKDFKMFRLDTAKPGSDLDSPDTLAKLAADKGKLVLTKELNAVHSSLGDFQVLDFSEVQQDGVWD